MPPTVIATVALAKEIGGFGLMDDVWVTDYKTAMCLAMAIRNGIKKEGVYAPAQRYRGQPQGIAPTI